MRADDFVAASETGHVAYCRSVDHTFSPIAYAGMQARNFTYDPVSSSACLAPEFYSEISLEGLVDRLCDSRKRIGRRDLLNLVVKYFVAYVDESTVCMDMPFADVARFYEGFGRHQSLNEPWDDIEMMNRLRRWSGVLRGLADAPRMAHAVRDILSRPASARGEYVGVDLGTSSGVLLLAQHIHARRSGCENLLIRGYMDDLMAGERTHALLRKLDAADVLQVSAAKPHAHRWLEGYTPTLVVNELLMSLQHSLNRENFIDVYETFGRTMGDSASLLEFYPQGIVAYSNKENASVILMPENGFSVPSMYSGMELVPQGFLVGGEVVPVHRLGSDFFHFLERD